MSKKSKKTIASQAKEESVELNESVVVNETAETLEEKPQKAEKKAKQAKAKKQKAVKAEGKKSKIKETFGELKKVTWPSFGKAMKQTGMVLSIVLIFGVLVLGIDLLVGYIINLLSSF